MQLKHTTKASRINLTAKHHLLGQCGFEIPNFEHFSLIEVTENTKIGNIRVTTNGRPNYIAFNPQSKLSGNAHVRFVRKAHDNLLIIGNNVHLGNGEFHFSAGNGTVFLGNNNRHYNAPTIRTWGDNNLIYLGNNTSSNGLNLSSKSSNLIIGEDCMFAVNVWIRNSDEHLIFELDSLEPINSSGEVIIYPHTWVCQDALILKNTRIGPGSIVGAKSLVTKDVPSFSVVGGNPAKVLKRNISWERRASEVQPATLEKINRYKAHYGADEV